MENPLSPKRIALTYSLLGLMVQGIEAQSEVLTLWYGRRCYERSRGEMTMMVYEKALSRKNVVGQEETEKANDKAIESNDTNGTVHAATGGAISKRKYHRYCGFFQRFWRKSEKSKPETKQPASMGKVLNLIRGDVYEIAQRFWEIESLVEKPLGLVFGVVLVWILLGPSCFVGIITILIAQAVNALITKILLQWERKRRTASDKRLNVTSTFVESLRRMFYSFSSSIHFLQIVSINHVLFSSFIFQKTQVVFWHDAFQLEMGITVDSSVHVRRELIYSLHCNNLKSRSVSLNIWQKSSNCFRIARNLSISVSSSDTPMWILQLGNTIGNADMNWRTHYAINEFVAIPSRKLSESRQFRSQARRNQLSSVARWRDMNS